MRRMSFAMTKRQYLDHTKDVTRRMGWLFLVGATPWTVMVMGVEKAMGLRKGEKQVELGASRVGPVCREPLEAIRSADVVREGFPEMTVGEFIDLYRKANRCSATDLVTRIEFKQQFTPVKGESNADRNQ